MLEKFRAANPGKTIYSIQDKAFSRYGKVYHDLDISDVACEVEKACQIPESGVFYTPTIPSAEAVPGAKLAQMQVYGGLPMEVGCCSGKNDTLNAFEYHLCTELTYAITDLVLILGITSDIVDGTYDTKNAEIFFVPKGTVFEVYPTTLHYAPCSVNPDGFMAVICLLKGTNTPLPEGEHDKKLLMTNKWLICHPEDQADLDSGAALGLVGENIRLTIPG